MQSFDKKMEVVNYMRKERKVKRGTLVASLDAPIFSCVFVYA
jgi:hypothetical protein